MAISRPAGSHVPALDGIRGVAILMVMLAHFTERISPLQPSTKPLLWFADAGWIGVDLFFVLSGYLITGILCNAKGAQNYFRAFYGRRVLRIFPLYYGVLIFMFFGLGSFLKVPPVIWGIRAGSGLFRQTLRRLCIKAGSSNPAG